MARRPNSLRLAGYDYRQPAAYFVTICVEGHVCRLGEVQGETVRLSAAGRLAEAAWRALPEHYPHVRLDAFVVMPNHVHGIVMIVDGGIVEPPDPDINAANVVGAGFKPAPTHGLPEIVRAFKTFSARRINELHGTSGRRLWQRGYWDRVLRNARELDGARHYIANNPLRWHLDRLHPDRR